MSDMSIKEKAYDDVLNPALKETGSILSLIPKTIKATLLPLRKWIANKEFQYDELEKMLELKLQNLTPEKIVEPEPYVAVPALQSISYSMNNSELRELYANLLAKAMYSDTKDMVHPSFVDIIKQLSPNDALFFKHVHELDHCPLIDVYLRVGINPESKTFTENYNQIDLLTEDIRDISIINLVRLGLLTIPASTQCADETLYESLIKKYESENDPNFDYLIPYHFSYQKKCLMPTAFGDLFYKICIEDF